MAFFEACRKKAIALIFYWGERLLWAPLFIRFRVRGNGHGWRIHTHLTRMERILIYRIGLRKKPGAVFVEIGSYLGASACFLAAAAKELGGGSKVYCVDTWLNEGMTEGLRDTWEEFVSNTRPYARWIVPLRGHSEDIAKGFGEAIDLLFIDGDHSYEGCRRDISAWLPYLREGGIVVLHDYGWAEGVRRVVTEWIQPRQKGRGHVFENTYWAEI